MLVKHGHLIQEMITSCPASEDNAWIDLAGNKVGQLKEVLDTLKWSGDVLHLLDLSPDRAQIQYTGKLYTISVFVPDAGAMKTLGILLGPGIIVTVHSQPIMLLEDLARELPNKSEPLDSAHYLFMKF